MLVDVNYNDNPIANIIAIANGNSTDVIRHEIGVYEIGHFSFDQIINTIVKWPDLENFNCYGVCDNYQQVLKKCEELKNPQRNFVVSITPVEKNKQPKEGGWRWHKWGPYIGTLEPKCEYLYDEPAIEKIFVYHVYEVFGKMKHEKHIEGLQHIKNIIEQLMLEEIDCDSSIPKDVINHLALLHSDLKNYLK